jgi:gas vesicle protein
MLGALVGAVVTLLLTPASGDELRSQMQAQVDRIQLEVRKAAEARRAELEQQLAELRTPRQ